MTLAVRLPRLAGIPPLRPDRIDPVGPPDVEPLPDENEPGVVPETEPTEPDIDEPNRSPEEYPGPQEDGRSHDGAASPRRKGYLE
ncbi:hypothetical protein Ga0102493_11156 [Erythrobacter litoralis]|uniref:hypothetical protein n=1 Tax=Erythrobacter litoralis TaxID=39960 RepID=UPI000845D5E2|nr:hypothetical protein [Erythrobacter litoralis]AOL24300.1 hypothetical protein Ga0102493_11156 [Erythrobacter litoralis]